jgi:hypothetical protein
MNERCTVVGVDGQLQHEGRDVSSDDLLGGWLRRGCAGVLAKCRSFSSTVIAYLCSIAGSSGGSMAAGTFDVSVVMTSLWLVLGFGGSNQ